MIGSWVAAFRLTLGAAMVCVAGHPSAGACVHRVFGQVFSFCPDVFSFRQMCPLSGQMCPLFPPTTPNVSTRPVHVSTQSLDRGFATARSARPARAGVGVISAATPPWEQGEPAPAVRGACRGSRARPSETFA